MKFLHEMIAKKRAQQDAKAPEADDARMAEPVPQTPFETPRPEAVTRDLDPEPVAAEAEELEDWDEDYDEDGLEEEDDDLFEDESYDWELEDAEEQEIPDEPAPVASAEPPHRPTIAPVASDDDEDESEDISRGVSMVLKDLAARSGAPEARPEPKAEPEPQRSSLEQNVEKLRIQRKIWDMDNAEEGEEGPSETAPPAAAMQPSATPEPVAREPLQQAPAPAPAPAAEAPQPRRAGRVKTRLLGFHKPEDVAPDPFAAPQGAAAPQGEPQFPVGWMVVMSGPGRGASFTLTTGASKIGRGEDQAIRLDFGDTSISRDNHAAVAYDEEQRCFYIGHGGKANLVRLNDMPVLSTEALADGDEIRIGETTLRFVAFCGPEFSWVDEDGDGDSRYAAAE